MFPDWEKCPDNGAWHCDIAIKEFCMGLFSMHAQAHPSSPPPVGDLWVPEDFRVESLPAAS